MSFYKIRPTSDGKFITAGIMAYNPSEDSLLVLKINSDLELDTFYTHDKNKYDYRCSRKIAFDSTINQSTDTIHIVIPYPDTLPKPGSFLVYPNPTSSRQVQVRTEASQNPANLTVYDMLGRRINLYQFVPGQTRTYQYQPWCHCPRLLYPGPGTGWQKVCAEADCGIRKNNISQLSKY